VLKEALAIAETNFGAESTAVAEVLNQIGMLGKYDGRFDEAEAAYSRALRIVAGSEHALAADLNHNLGGLEHTRGNFAKGEPFARRSVEIRSRLYGPDHPDTARDLAALAALIDGQHRFEEAEVLYLAAISILEGSSDSEIDLAVIFNNLAALCQATGRMDEAEKLYLRCLAIKERFLGMYHPEVALTLNNLAVFYRSESRLSEAARIYLRAIAIFEKALDPGHPRLVGCRRNYERARAEMRNF